MVKEGAELDRQSAFIWCVLLTDLRNKINNNKSDVRVAV